MKSEKTNIEHLRDIIEKEMFNKVEALEFLDAIEDELEKTSSELDDANDGVREYEGENTIDCGIGNIEWSADNIQLIALMENLEERIKLHGSLVVMKNLQLKLQTS